MIDKEVLGHKLSLYNNFKSATAHLYFDYECIVCGIYVYSSKSNYELYYVYNGDELTLTCNETLIKNLLE